MAGVERPPLVFRHGATGESGLVAFDIRRHGLRPPIGVDVERALESVTVEDCHKSAVCGRGVRQGTELGSFPMRDIGPTIAGLMGVELPTARGTDRSGEVLE